MAARISHAAALEVVSLWAMDQHTNAHLEAQRDGRDLLRAYIAQQAALEADTARAARLEELVSNWGDVANWLLGCGWYLPSSVHSRIDKLKEHLSTAPQASTEQAPPSPVEESFCEGLYAGAMGLPAQPAPGGTERPCPKCSSSDKFCSVLGCIEEEPEPTGAHMTAADFAAVSSTGDDDPTSAEPQGHWSDCSDCVRDGGHCKRHPAGAPPVDYVTYEVLIEALNDYDNDGLARHLLDRLEKARRR